MSDKKKFKLINLLYFKGMTDRFVLHYIDSGLVLLAHLVSRFACYTTLSVDTSFNQPLVYEKLP